MWWAGVCVWDVVCMCNCIVYMYRILWFCLIFISALRTQSHNMSCIHFIFRGVPSPPLGWQSPWLCHVYILYSRGFPPPRVTKSLNMSCIHFIFRGVPPPRVTKSLNMSCIHFILHIFLYILLKSPFIIPCFFIFQGVLPPP